MHDGYECDAGSVDAIVAAGYPIGHKTPSGGEMGWAKAQALHRSAELTQTGPH